MPKNSEDDSLEDEPFDYQVTKDGKVLIYWQGKLVTTLASDRARKFIQQVDIADFREAQLLMARFTGNFKRGNEREGKNKR